MKKAKASNELAQLNAKDPLPLDRARINQGAAVRRVKRAEKAARKAEAAAAAERELASAAAEKARASAAAATAARQQVCEMGERCL